MSTPVLLPYGCSTVTVSAINVGASTTWSPASFFMEPVLPGNEGAFGPMYTFLVEHPATRTRLMFDLGLRKDPENLSPAVQRMLQIWSSLGPYTMEANGDVAGRLKEENIDLNTISSVIWSHSHLDHTGDMATLPPSTELVVGPGTDLRTYPAHSDAILVESDLANRKVTEISFKDSVLQVAGLPAIDYFGDGSFFLLDTPGHHPGHISALARVTEGSFVLLGGDCCHHPGQIRPTVAHHTQCPCPGDLLESTRRTICPEFANKDAKEFDLLSRTEPMLSLPTGHSGYADIKVAKATLDKIALLDAHPDVLFLIAHDSTTPEVIEEFPKTLNDWKAKGWKEKLTWAFLDKESKGFRFSKKAQCGPSE